MDGILDGAADTLGLPDGTAETDGVSVGVRLSGALGCVRELSVRYF